MKSGIRWEVAVTLLVAAFSFFSAGATMRETDQAALLQGALLLARGEASAVSPEFYNYDKQFVSFWITAAALKLRFREGQDVEAAFADLTRAGNLAATLILWPGILFLVWRAGRGDRQRAMMLSAVLLAPCFLLSASLLSSNVISGGFLGFLAGVLGGKERDRNGIWRALVVLGLTFAAVGARADAVLCLPFLCWITVPRARWRELVRRKIHWAAAAGAVVALVTGRILTAAPVVDRYPPFFVSEVALAYLVFGLGGAGLVMLCLLTGFGGALRKTASAGRKSLLVAGLCFALLPLGYYSAQLFSPRHLLTTVWVLLFSVLFSRGRALLRVTFSTQARKIVATSCVCAAVIPIFAGLDLPQIGRPRLSWNRSTLYPTADGLWPMGAYGTFLRQLGRASHRPIDHNQELWGALSRTKLPEAGGEVPIYPTPMWFYFGLAASLQGQPASSWDRESSSAKPFWIVDERELRRNPESAARAPREAATWLADLRQRPKRLISGLGERQSIVKIDSAGAGPSDPGLELRLAVAELFYGDDFTVREVGGDEFTPDVRDRGRRVMFFSVLPFQMREIFPGAGSGDLEVEAGQFAVPGLGEKAWYFVRIPEEAAGDPLRFEFGGEAVEQGAELYVAASTLMGYMSVQRWQQRRNSGHTFNDSR